MNKVVKVRVRKAISVGVAIALAIGLTGVTGTKEASAKGFKIIKKKMAVGDTYKWKVKGANVKYYSGCKGIATVSKKGKITAKAVGYVAIIAKVKKKIKCRMSLHVVSKKVKATEQPSTTYSLSTATPTSVASATPLASATPAPVVSATPLASATPTPVASATPDVKEDSEDDFEAASITIPTDYYESTFYSLNKGTIDKEDVHDFVDTEWMKEYLGGCGIYRCISDENRKLDLIVYVKPGTTSNNGSHIKAYSFIYKGEELEKAKITIPEHITLHFTDSKAEEYTVTFSEENIASILMSDEINTDFSAISKIPDNSGFSRIKSYTYKICSKELYEYIQSMDSKLKVNKRLQQITQ